MIQAVLAQHRASRTGGVPDDPRSNDPFRVRVTGGRLVVPNTSGAWLARVQLMCAGEVDAAAVVILCPAPDDINYTAEMLRRHNAAGSDLT